MIMPRGQQLLLPVNPGVHCRQPADRPGHQSVPLGRWVWMPDLLMVLIVFWGVHQPCARAWAWRLPWGFAWTWAVGPAGAACPGVHRAFVQRDCHPPPPAVVQRASAGAAGVSAVCLGAWHRSGAALAGRWHVSGFWVLLAPVLEVGPVAAGQLVLLAPQRRPRPRREPPL